MRKVVEKVGKFRWLQQHTKKNNLSDTKCYVFICRWYIFCVSALHNMSLGYHNTAQHGLECFSGWVILLQPQLHVCFPCSRLMFSNWRSWKNFTNQTFLHAGRVDVATALTATNMRDLGVGLSPPAAGEGCETCSNSTLRVSVFHVWTRGLRGGWEFAAAPSLLHCWLFPQAVLKNWTS